MKIDKIVTIVGSKLFEMIGFSWELEPKALNKFEKKYITNIMTKEKIIVFVNLSFCFRFWVIDDANSTREAIKNGKNTNS